jgi:hypothetical protein
MAIRSVSSNSGERNECIYRVPYSVKT